MTSSNFRNARYKTSLMLVVFCFFITSNVFAEVKTKTVTYKDGDVNLIGELAWDDGKSEKRPGVLVIDEWWGLTEWGKTQARRLAAAGYVAFAADMYGDGKTTNDPKTAGNWMKEVTGDKARWLRRTQLGLDILKANTLVDAESLAAMGSSFGGATVIQMAYAGQDIKAAVCIASAQVAPPPKSVTTVKPRLMVFFGNDDQSATTDKIAAFRDGFAGVDADWGIIIYSDTRHSFTNPAADTHGIKNLAYNEKSARRAWAAILSLFEEAFKK